MRAVPDPCRRRRTDYRDPQPQGKKNTGCTRLRPGTTSTAANRCKRQGPERSVSTPPLLPARPLKTFLRCTSPPASCGAPAASRWSCPKRKSGGQDAYAFVRGHSSEHTRSWPGIYIPPRENSAPLPEQLLILRRRPLDLPALHAPHIRLPKPLSRTRRDIRSSPRSSRRRSVINYAYEGVTERRIVGR
jgi:hypothetical protein